MVNYKYLKSFYVKNIVLISVHRITPVDKTKLTKKFARWLGDLTGLDSYPEIDDVNFKSMCMV